MNRYTWTENGFTFKRINKAQARRAYNNGLRVVVCPVNLRPGYPFHPEIKQFLIDCAGLGLVQCSPGWCTGYNDYNGTIKAIKAAIKEMRDELRTIPTWAQYNRAC